MPTIGLTGFTFENDRRPRDITLSYRTYGTLAADGGNTVLMPSYYTGSSDDYDAWIGDGALVDPERWYVVVVDMLGNGRSTSPSTLPGVLPAVVTISDDVRAQELLLDALGVGRIALAAGWSMGAMQSLAWASHAPHRVGAVLAVCGTAACWPMNQAFLAGIEPFLDLGREGLRPFGRAYAGWCYSATFLREGLYRQLGCRSLEELLTRWEDDHATWHPEDLRAMLRTWASAGEGPVLERVRARTVYAPASTDQYFTAEEARLEASRIPRSDVVVLDSPWGHATGRPGLLPHVTAQLAELARDLLARA